MSTDEAFLQSLRSTFRVEAAEHLQTLYAALLELEREHEPQQQAPIIERIFRAAHSLKGAARAVNFTDIETVCQELETTFSRWRRRESAPTPPALDQAHRGLDQISASIGQSAPAALPAAESPLPVSAPLLSAQLPPAAALGGQGDDETVRVSLQTLDAHLLETEELLAAKLSSAQRASDLGELAARFEHWNKTWIQAQPHSRAAAGASPAVHEFLDWNERFIRSLHGTLETLRRAAEQDRLSTGRLVDELLANSKKMLMLPMSTLTPLLSKIVRDLCRDQGKQAELVVRGADITLDKRILDELKDPLIHLLRNCVDHGIETSAQRLQAGKSARASIVIELQTHDDHEAQIAITDDGAGIDVARVLQAAGERGQVAAAAAPAAALALVFETDVSTSSAVTTLSGRGLGLAIVREKTEKLGGRVSIDSQPGTGTTIRMRVPLTLSTFRGVLIRANERLFVVPTNKIERVLRFTSADVRTVEARRTLSLDGQAVALAELAQVLELPRTGEAARSQAEAARPALIIGSGAQRLALAVDAVIDEREILVKPLGRPLLRVRNLAGATVLGSGELAPILNISDVLLSARRHGAEALELPSPRASAQSSKRLLIAEDSITSRMLLKGILESAGYQVRVAVDGVDAFMLLRSEHFDAVVSDVEMPRMNGFDLTAKIRAERSLANVPVVLVTALSSREDRERGIDVGANAYIVKSSLDQSNLLETLRRLV